MTPVPDAGRPGELLRQILHRQQCKTVFFVERQGQGLPLPGDLQVHVRVKGNLHNHSQLRIEPGLVGHSSIGLRLQSEAAKALSQGKSGSDFFPKRRRAPLAAAVQDAVRGTMIPEIREAS